MSLGSNSSSSRSSSIRTMPTKPLIQSLLPRLRRECRCFRCFLHLSIWRCFLGCLAVHLHPPHPRPPPLSHLPLTLPLPSRTGVKQPPHLPKQLFRPRPGGYFDRLQQICNVVVVFQLPEGTMKLLIAVERFLQEGRDGPGKFKTLVLRVERPGPEGVVEGSPCYFLCWVCWW